MPNFSSSDVLLSAAVEIRVQEDKLRKDLARARQTVQATTDAMTKKSIASMKNKSKAMMRAQKLEQQQTVRGIQTQVAAQGVVRRENAKAISEQKKAATQRDRNARTAARQQREAAHRVGKMASAFRMLGVQVAIVGVIISVMFKKMLNQFSEFDRSMRKATAVTTFNLQQYTQMSSMAEEASINLNVAATNTADAFYFLGSAGLNAEQQMKAFIPVVTLAKAATIEAGQAAEIMVDTMKGFKIPFEETAHVAAVMAKSVISSNMNFLQLGETLSLVAGVARTTNNTLEETNAMIQLMANVGIKGTRAGTTLRRSMLNLAAPSEKINRLFETMGVEIENQSGIMKPYIQLVGEISDALKDATEGQKNMAFKTLFGARAIAGQLEIFDAGSKKLREMTLILDMVGDTHEEIAEKQMAAFSEQIGKITKNFEKLQRHLSSKFAPSLLMISKSLDKIISKTTKWADSNEELVGTLQGTGIAMGGILTVTGAGLTTLASLALVSTGLEVSFLALASGVGIALGVLTLLVTAIISVIAAIARSKNFHRQNIKNYKDTAMFVNEATKAQKRFNDVNSEFTSNPRISRISERMSDITADIKDLNRENKILSDFLSGKGAGFSETSMKKKFKGAGEDIPRKILGRTRTGPILGDTSMKKASEELLQINKNYIETLQTHHRGFELARITALSELEEANRRARAKDLGELEVWSRETLEIVRDMYGDIQGEVDGLSFKQLSARLIELEGDKKLADFKKAEFINEKNRAEEVAKFQVLINEWKNQQIMKSDLEAAKRSNSFAEGFKAQSKEMSKDIKSMGEVGADVSVMMKDSMADIFIGLTKDTKNWKSVMLDALKSLESALINLAAQQLALKLFAGSTANAAQSNSKESGLLAIGTALAGAYFGAQGTGTPSGGAPGSGAAGIGTGDLGGGFSSFQGGTGGGVPDTLRDPGFTFHSGGHVGSSRGRRLKRDEFGATLRSGERVLRRGERKGGGGSGEPSGDPQIVNVNITAMDSQSVFQALKPLKKQITSLVQSAGRDNHSMRRSGGN